MLPNVDLLVRLRLRHATNLPVTAAIDSGEITMGRKTNVKNSTDRNSQTVQFVTVYRKEDISFGVYRQMTIMLGPSCRILTMIAIIIAVR